MTTMKEIKAFAFSMNLKEMYEEIQKRILDCEDTMSDEFKLLAELEEVFVK
jgi:hypothetical protein